MIVGIYSPVPQSGKSTVSKVFQLAGYRKLSLATAVKKSLLVVLQELGVKDAEEYLWGRKKDEVIPEIGVTGGYLMSTYATDYMRDTVNQDLWLNIVKRKINPNKKYVIDDMRFSNEFLFCNVRIIVYRDSQEAHGRSEKSEGQLNSAKFDYVIINQDSLEQLERTARGIVEQIDEEQNRQHGNTYNQTINVGSG